ncbi:hypothetical protein, partial [Colwellia sp. C1TZA3]|uniref:hypothetical protein n=1 Tax=Colwellia sp. C1TZA3 TaxID=2508879 RepID=UPI001CB8A11B
MAVHIWLITVIARSTVDGLKYDRQKMVKRYIIPIPLSYCSLVLVKIAQGCVALTPNSQLLLNRAPYLELFFLR